MRVCANMYVIHVHAQIYSYGSCVWSVSTHIVSYPYVYAFAGIRRRKTRDLAWRHDVACTALKGITRVTHSSNEGSEHKVAKILGSIFTTVGRRLASSQYLFERLAERFHLL